MPSIADILEFSTDRLTSSEVSRKRAILLLRWTLFGCILGLGTAGSEDFFQLLPITVSLGLFVAVNLALSFLPLHAFRAPTFEFSLSLFDTALISYVIFEADPTGFLCLFFFLLLVSTAASNKMSQFLLASTIMSALYILVRSVHAPRAELFSVFQLMVLPFFYTTAVYFGFQVLQIRDRRAQEDRIYRERKELQIVLSILESITSSLDFHGVMFQIASRIAEVVDAMRCSILLVEGERDEKAFVVASNDDRRLRMLPVDLAKYPEVQMAIRQRKAVVIEDIEKSDLLKPFLEDLRKLHFHSLLILPILYQEAVIGTLFLRAARKRSFSQEELKFCRVVASAAASAIKNSMLYRSLQERARAQEESSARIRGLLDSSPDLILQLDEKGRIEEANRATEQLSGRTREDLLSLEVDSLIRGLPPVSELMERARVSRSSLCFDASLHPSTGPERSLSVTVGLHGEADVRRGLILTGRDVTEERQANERLQRTERLSSIGEIVASVAHELNNPLSGVLGFSQLLAQKEGEGKYKRDIERIVECADRCQKIVQNLLSFARPSQPEKKPLGLNGVLEKTLDLLEPSLRSDDIEVVRELDPKLPYVLGDFHQIQQVFTNLITNARQAMSAQKGRGRLVLKTTQSEGRVLLEVRDDGPGIPPENLPRIFDPFFSTKQQGRGTGLGLSVSYGIVREHGGELRVDSKVGQGTTFAAFFPIHEESLSADEGGSSVASPPQGGKEILVVDDEEVIVELYLELLEALGHTIDTASTGLEALRKIEGRNYDLVITDIKMPKMTGIQLYEKVISIKPAMKRRFIFITGDMNSLSGQQFLTVTDNPCLLKPVNIETIEATIRKLLIRAEAPSAAAGAKN